eukprot:CAMPEP_0177650932 /NCGR_PEP_ID=MMETSP0447-20121125/12236_1 /TAXON_ID=0 /ORGANISM="Stygamoeba regulata, Strain BSH-02190019" /LENGTH=350 /DNA_ID=CAMNT_0019153895 /DNA_START=84 /DNA_END=1136 /DNA_ORIENTATION=+
MGCAGSAPVENTAENKSIESDLKKTKKRLQAEVRLLLLGASESGKSTIARQFQMINGAFSASERKDLKQAVHLNIVECMKILLRAARRFNIPLQEANKDKANVLLANKFQCDVIMTDEVVQYLKALWKDDAIQKTFGRSREFYLPECSKYLFENLERLCQPDFEPTDNDCLRVRQRTLGVIETQFVLNQRLYKIVDVGGQRSERRKWINFFDNVTCLLYCVALDEYDLLLYEDNKTSRMAEALKLFEDIVKMAEFGKTPILLFLNKSDLLKEKIKDVTPAVLFPEYDGGNNYDAALEWIKNMYLLIAKSGGDRKVYPHVTCALDQKTMKFVWNATSDVIVSQGFQNAGVV